MNTIREPHRIKARKAHTCDYCDKQIAVGEEHEVATYAQDGTVYNWRTCDRCRPFVSEAFTNKHYHHLWTDGMGSQDFQDYMWEEHSDVAKEWWH